MGSNGAVNIEGDSLAILEGRFSLYAGQASAIKAPIIGGNTGAAFNLAKTGPGVLTLSRNAIAWPAVSTNPTATNGVFNSENTVLLSGVNAAEAFYAFGVRPTSEAAATPVYLRLNTGLSSVYGNTPVFTYSLYDAITEGNVVSNALANPSGTVVWTGSPTASSSVGGYSLTYASGIELGSSSYLLNAGAAVSYTVAARPVTITPDAKMKVYGNVDPALTYSVTTGNLVGADTLTGTLSRVAGENVGGRVISASGFNAEGINTNYTVSTSTGLLTISARPITITPDAKTKVYGESDPTLTYAITSGNLLENDILTGALTRAGGSGVGIYAISAASLANANYAITPVNSTLTISEAPVTATAAVSSVYIVPPVVSRPASAQLSLGLQLVDVAPAAKADSNQVSGAGALGFDPDAAAKRAPGTVLVLTGGVKRAADDKEEGSNKKASTNR